MLVLCLDDAGGCVGDTGGGWVWAGGSSRCIACVPPDPCHPLSLGFIQLVVATIQTWEDDTRSEHADKRTKAVTSFNILENLFYF